MSNINELIIEKINKGGLFKDTKVTNPHDDTNPNVQTGTNQSDFHKEEKISQNADKDVVRTGKENNFSINKKLNKIGSTIIKSSNVTSA